MRTDWHQNSLCSVVFCGKGINKRGDVRMHMADSLGYTAETDRAV